MTTTKLPPPLIGGIEQASILEEGDDEDTDDEEEPETETEPEN